MDKLTICLIVICATSVAVLVGIASAADQVSALIELFTF